MSEALGGDDACVALAEAAHTHDMGIVLDIVPNHMGIGADNPYWDDLLANGRGSRYADWFDVAWRAPTKRLSGKVLVPVLGDTLEKVLARGEITLETRMAAFALEVVEREAAATDRRAQLHQAIVLVSRCTASLGSPPVGQMWGDTWLELGNDRPAGWRCLINGTRIADVMGQMRIGDVFSVLPVAVLVQDRMSSCELVS